jgi:menaquinol-cytochrome c reductase iron-sulfur subunit
MATQQLHLTGRNESGQQKLQRCAVPERRSFFGALLTTGAAAVAAVFCWPLARYVAYPVYATTTEEPWMDLGSLDEFASSREPVRKLVQVKEVSGWQQTTQQSAVYVTRDAQNTLVVLSSTCPHLGCSVAWQSASGKFVCPCHGGCFAADGSRISGPPPRNMTVLETKTDNGRLAVRYTSRPS